MVSPLSTNPNTNTDTVPLDCSGNIITSFATDLEGSISMWGKSSFHFLNVFIIYQGFTMSKCNSNQKSPLSRCLTCRRGQSRSSTCLCTGEPSVDIKHDFTSRSAHSKKGSDYRTLHFTPFSSKAAHEVNEVLVNPNPNPTNFKYMFMQWLENL